MMEAIQVQIYVLAMVVSLLLWDAYVLASSWRARKTLVCIQRSAFTRVVTRSLWWVSLVHTVCSALIIMVTMYRNQLMLPVLLDYAPWVAFLLYVQYGVFALMGTLPVTLLFILISGLREIERKEKEGEITNGC